MINAKTAKEMLVDVIDDIEKWIPMFEQHNAPATLEAVIELVDSQQAEIDRLRSEQPKKGHWEDDCICSVCHWMHEDDEGNALITVYDYCPVCGARMDGDQK